MGNEKWLFFFVCLDGALEGIEMLLVDWFK